MPILLANTELLLPTGELCEWVDRHISQDEAFVWLQPVAGFASLAPSTVEAPRYRMPTKFCLNEFIWPLGASRWATGAFLATSDQADQVRTAANGSDGTTSTPIPLVMTTPGDPSQETLQTNVTLLRVTPLSYFLPSNNGTPTADDDFSPVNLHLLIVVDARFSWQASPCPDFKIPAPGLCNPASVSDPESPNYQKQPQTPVKWEDCIAACAASLGVTIDVDDVPTPYLFPDPVFNLPGYSIGLVLDAIAANLGMRFVANLDGTYNIQSATNAIAARQSDDASEAGQARPLRGGGDGFADTV